MGKAIEIDKAGKKILTTISRVQPIWPAKLQRTLLKRGHEFSQPALSYRLKRYADAGWITKTRQEEGKYVFLTITEEGREVLA